MALAVGTVDHISMGSDAWGPASEVLERLFGFARVKEFGPSDLMPFTGCTQSIRGSDIEWEILGPDTRAEDGGFVQKFVEERGGGLHHIAVEVEDVDDAARELEQLGVRPWGGVTEDGEWRMTYIHPKESQGVLWQLFKPLEPRGAKPRVETKGGAVGVVRVDHVALAVEHSGEQAVWQRSVFGMREESRGVSYDGEYRSCRMSIPGTALAFEVMAPARPEGFVQRFLDRRGPGLHHVAFEVESVERAVAALAEEGIEAYGGVVNTGGEIETFVHPRDGAGVLWKLFERAGGAR